MKRSFLLAPSYYVIIQVFCALLLLTPLHPYPSEPPLGTIHWRTYYMLGAVENILVVIFLLSNVLYNYMQTNGEMHLKSIRKGLFSLKNGLFFFFFPNTK